MQSIEFVYSLGSHKTIEVWEVIRHILVGHDGSDLLFMYGKEIKAAEIPMQLKKSNGNSFNLESESYVIQMATVTNYRHIVLQIDVKKNYEEKWWSEWVRELIFLEGFVQAWLVDLEYNYWQNATDPIEYESKGVSFDDLPMKSNGLPPPLEQTQIDTSANPGLRKLCDGYVEAIGAHMWLSENFLNLVGKNIEGIERSSEFVVNRIDSSVYHLSCPGGVFVDGTTGEQQQQLRSVLYE